MSKTKIYIVIFILSIILGMFITEYVIKGYYRKKTYIKKLN